MITEIQKCRICGNTRLVKIMDLGNQELSGRFPGIGHADPPKSPLVLVKCDNSQDETACGLVQLKHSFSPEEMFQQGYGYLSGINSTMKQHLETIVERIESKVHLKEGDIVLDIGSNDGTLLKSYKTPGLRRLGIDPGGEQYKKYYPEDIGLVSDFFSYYRFNGRFPKQKAKIITSIAMMYDLEDPMQFVKDIKSVLDSDGMWVFEQSYLPKMLESNSFDTICHEHLEYYSLQQIEWMLSWNEMKIIDVEVNMINGGSFKVYATHNNSKIKYDVTRVKTARSNEVKLKLNRIDPYTDFVKRVENQKQRLVSFVNQETALGKTFFVYGASTKGNVLLNYFGLDNKVIKVAADRNPEKWGCMTPGTHIPIISEEEARKMKPDYFIVLPWHFKREFITREQEFLKNGGSFVFPLPYMEVVGVLNG